jgi:OmpA-OmpF porin, OOP family
MHRIFRLLTLVVLSVALSGTLTPAAAQFGKLTDKIKQAGKVEGALGGKKGDSAKEQPTEEKKSDEAKEEKKGADSTPAPKSAAGSATAEDMTLYAKYDFVPGDRVIFYDDLSREEMGEFPSRWNLDQGVFENVKMAGQNWILCSNKGMILPKISTVPLPDKYTVEMEIWSEGDTDGWYTILWYGPKNAEIGKLELGYSYMTNLFIMGKRLADRSIPRLSRGKHVIRIMATKTTLKCYIDQERIANVPKVEGFAPVKIGVEINPYNERNKTAVIGAFRFAEGGKTLKEQLDEDGKIVTHGILFDSGSARIKAESFKTLADISGLLTDNPALRISIEGHTDSDGTDAANLTLSQNRAQSVKAYLMENYKIDAGRMETKGLGESKPIDTNDTPEGKATNRRVELIKL